MIREHDDRRLTRFAGLRAKCTCGAVWSLRGYVLVEHENGQTARDTGGFPLHEVRCTCGALAHGFVPRGAVPSTIKATLAV